MSSFSVAARRIQAIEPHTNADALEFAVIDDYRAIVRKGAHAAGDLVVYLPEGAQTNEPLLRQIGLWDEARGKGRCAGDDGLRVKAVMLRGQLSQGIVYPLLRSANDEWTLVDAAGAEHPVRERQEVAQLLGVTKFKPVIPAELDGLVFDGGIEYMPRFDIEDIKKYPGVFEEGEEVVMTEKLHGTFSGFLKLPDSLVSDEFGPLRVFSKGLSEQALSFQDVPENQGNVYVRAAHAFDMSSRLDELRHALVRDGLAGALDPVFIFGEVIGAASKQDLKYGHSLQLRVFAMGYGTRSALKYLGYDARQRYADELGLQTVPLIYRGPFSKQALQEATSGKETVSGQALHIREGVVVTPVVERRHPEIGRVILKSVSPNYLVRGGEATEYN